MKRWFGFFLAIMIVCISFAGCSSKKVANSAKKHTQNSVQAAETQNTDQLQTASADTASTVNNSQTFSAVATASKSASAVNGMAQKPAMQSPVQNSNNEYQAIKENGYINTNENPLSTFSVNVDTASYSLVRRYLQNGQTVPSDAVRIEELINYFKYDFPKPTGSDPISVYSEVADCPWKSGEKLLLVGLQGKEIDKSSIPTSNLVFLLDVSGSMSDSDKLPLVKKAFGLLIDNLRENDRISIVTYAGSESVALKGAYGSNKTKIADAIQSLESGGSTAGAKGIETAYNIAKEYFIKGGNNRVILATDGDFNVGVSSDAELKNLIEQKRKDGIYLSVMGFGDGNLKDNKMETLAKYGNGNYSYIDSELEAKKVLVEEMGGTLLTIAKDVKVQMSFNQNKIKSYRLIGYDNRMLSNSDYKDDTKDAGEMGAGHRVTAIYQFIPSDNGPSAAEWAKVGIRYKNPSNDTVKEMNISVDNSKYTGKMSESFAFASSVAEFGLLLRNSQYKGTASYANAYNRIKNLESIKKDPYKLEFLDFLRKFAD